MLRTVRPIPQSLRGGSCCKCDRLQAVWDLPNASGPSSLICSLCVLYSPEVWSRSLETTISEIESAKRVTFLRDLDTRLLRCADADDVVGVLVLTARVASMGAQAHAQRST